MPFPRRRCAGRAESAAGRNLSPLEKPRTVHKHPGGATSGGGVDNGGQTIEWLPGEVVALVFGFLDAKTLMVTIPSVCTAWRQACSELGTPIQLDFGWATTGPKHDPRNPLTDADLGGFALGRFKTVRSVSLVGCRKVTDVGSTSVGEGCPNLDSLRWREFLNVIQRQKRAFFFIRPHHPSL